MFNTGANWEIAVDGRPRSYRDDRAVAMEAALYLKYPRANQRTSPCSFGLRRPPVGRFQEPMQKEFLENSRQVVPQGLRRADRRHEPPRQEVQDFFRYRVPVVAQDFSDEFL